MSATTVELLEELKKLPYDDKVEIFNGLWESFADESFPLSEETIADLERRLDEYEKNPGRARPWPEVEARIRERLASCR